MTHVLKVWPEFFKDLRSGVKTFEVRKNDRGFVVGDELHLREYRPPNGICDCHACSVGQFGDTLIKRVTYVLHGGQFGIEPGFVVLGLGAA